MPVKSARRDRGTAWDAGFTLLEMLVVIVILGLSIALVVSRGPARSVSLDVEGAARSIAQNLRQARSEAIATDHLVAFSLDPSSRLTVVNGQLAFHLAPEVSATITTATGGEIRPQVAITFASDGSSSGGQVILSAGTRHILVVVDWLTGRVMVANAP